MGFFCFLFYLFRCGFGIGLFDMFLIFGLAVLWLVVVVRRVWVRRLGVLG